MMQVISHIGWIDEQGNRHWKALPLKASALDEILKDIKRNGLPSISPEGKTNWYVTIYKDYYIPSITLSLALEYFN